MRGQPALGADVDSGLSRRAYRVTEVMQMTGLKRWKIMTLIGDGRLRARKLDRVILVEAGSLDTFLAAAPLWTGSEPQARLAASG